MLQHLKDRTQLLARLGQKMKRIASKYNVAFVVINQVRSVLTRWTPGTLNFDRINCHTLAQVSARENTLEFETGAKHRSQCSPALGLVWANCVNHR